MVRALLSVSIFMIIFPNSQVQAESDSYWILLDGKYLNTDQTPIQRNGSVYVPMRLIFESLQAKVTYLYEEEKIIGQKGDVTIELYLGKTTAYRDDQAVLLSGPPLLVDNSVYVPIRFISESLGATVNWDAELHVVEIETARFSSRTELPVVNDRGDPAILEHQGNMTLKWSFQDESPYQLYKGYLGPKGELIFTNFGMIKVMDREGKLENEWPFKDKKIPWKINDTINKGMPAATPGTSSFQVAEDNKTLYKIDPDTDEVLWTYALPVSEEKMGYSFFPSSQHLDSYGTLYISTQGGMLHALNAVDGKLKFKLIMNHKIISETQAIPLSATELVVVNNNAILFFEIND